MAINKIPELLCPAGDLTRLCAAVDYRADAVYLAGEEFGMRTAAANFGEEDLKKGIEYAHKHGVKVHRRFHADLAVPAVQDQRNASSPTLIPA